MHTITYAQMRRNAHAAGGETMTEAAAKMRGLGRLSTAFLSSVLADLRREAQACTSMADYAEVRSQVDRFRSILISRGAL